MTLNTNNNSSLALHICWYTLIAGYKILQSSPEQETSKVSLVREMLQLKQQLT